MYNKSIRNCKTAIWAETNSFYDVAISRYYYSLFQKIIYISKKRKFYETPPQGKGSHEFAIDNFFKNMNTLLENSETTKMASIRKLKNLRRTADYENEIIDKTYFTNVFMKSYSDVDSVLDRLVVLVQEGK